MPFGEVGPLFNIGKKVNPSAYLVVDPKLISEWSKKGKTKNSLLAWLAKEI